jgi:hypothetical protein
MASFLGDIKVSSAGDWIKCVKIVRQYACVEK